MDMPGKEPARRKKFGSKKNETPGAIRRRGQRVRGIRQQCLPIHDSRPSSNRTLTNGKRTTPKVRTAWWPHRQRL